MAVDVTLLCAVTQASNNVLHRVFSGSLCCQGNLYKQRRAAMVNAQYGSTGTYSCIKSHQFCPKACTPLHNCFKASQAVEHQSVERHMAQTLCRKCISLWPRQWLFCVHQWFHLDQRPVWQLLVVFSHHLDPTCRTSNFSMQHKPV